MYEGLLPYHLGFRWRRLLNWNIEKFGNTHARFRGELFSLPYRMKEVEITL